MRNGGKAGLAVLPTGTGKSHIIAELIQELFLHNNKHKILMVTHVKELIEQNYEKLKLHWKTPKGRPPAGINSAGLSQRHFTQPIIYAGIQSIYKDASKFGKVTALLIDECHLLSDKSTGMYKTFIKGLRSRNPELRIFGFTATPFRMDMGHLVEGDTFDDVFYDISQGVNFIKLINEGYLSNLRGIQPKEELDLSKVEVTKNEFKAASLDNFVNRAEITKKIVAETIQWTEEREKGLAFCVSKSHAEDMSMKFNEIGITSTFVHSDLSADIRAKRLSDFKNGRYNVMTNVGVLTTGFDAPDIDFIVMARPTRSPSLHIQMLGRGMRPYPNKIDCLVLDYGGNIKRLGFVNEVSLPQKVAPGTDLAKVKKCKNCSSLIKIAEMKCHFCNAEVRPNSRQISPNPEVHVGKIINDQNDRPRVKKGTFLKLKAFHNDKNFMVFEVSKYTMGNEIVALVVVNQKNYREFKVSKKEKGIFSLTRIESEVSNRRFKTISKLKSFLVAQLGANSLKILQNENAHWKKIWPKLVSLSGPELLEILYKYGRYQAEMKNANLQIQKTRNTAFKRFFEHVFSSQQAFCPLDSNNSGCLFEFGKSRLLICQSCGKVLTAQRVLEGFKARYVTKKINNFPIFFKKNLMDETKR